MEKGLKKLLRSFPVKFLKLKSFEKANLQKTCEKALKFIEKAFKTKKASEKLLANFCDQKKVFEWKKLFKRRNFWNLNEKICEKL